MDKVLNLLGLIYRAKKMVLGEEVYKQIKKVKYIIMASDISEASKVRVLKKIHYYQIEYLDKYSSAELSSAIGKNNIKLIGIIDEGFKKSLVEKI